MVSTLTTRSRHGSITALSEVASGWAGLRRRPGFTSSWGVTVTSHSLSVLGCTAPIIWTPASQEYCRNDSVNVWEQTLLFKVYVLKNVQFLKPFCLGKLLIHARNRQVHRRCMRKRSFPSVTWRDYEPPAGTSQALGHHSLPSAPELLAHVPTINYCFWQRLHADWNPTCHTRKTGFGATFQMKPLVSGNPQTISGGWGPVRREFEGQPASPASYPGYLAFCVHHFIFGYIGLWHVSENIHQMCLAFFTHEVSMGW